MNRTDLERLLRRCLDGLEAFRSQWPDFAADATLAVEPRRLEAVLDEYLDRLGGNYPFHHPLYAGQMLKPPHPVAIAAYLTAMHINPNNHALDGGPPTAMMEREVVARLASLFGWDTHLGHLTGGGTVANLEALWVARELGPGLAVAASAEAHYTHQRMCRVLGIPFVTIESDGRGRMDVGALRRALDTGRIGTIVGTLGTTALGALDPLEAMADLARERQARLHVDAAYGGFFRLLAGQEPDGVDPGPFLAATRADSIVIDPHKHGLQPYGCGCVLFRDPEVARFYHHDSAYTYYTSREQHLGEISLECSRPGAAAAALWVTLECLPLAREEGLGPVLRCCRRAARRWADLLRRSTRFDLLVEPELDIVVFFPRPRSLRASEVTELTERVFRDAMSAPLPIYLSKLRVASERIAARDPAFIADRAETVVLRSCLMKPEHEGWVDRLHAALERHVDAAIGPERTSRDR